MLSKITAVLGYVSIAVSAFGLGMLIGASC